MAISESCVDMGEFIELTCKSQITKLIILKEILNTISVIEIGEESEVGDGTSTPKKFDMSLMFSDFFSNLYSTAFKASAEKDRLNSLLRSQRPRKKKFYSNSYFLFKKQFFCVIVGMHLSAILEVLDYCSFQEMFKVGIKRYKKLNKKASLILDYIEGTPYSGCLKK